MLYKKLLAIAVDLSVQTIQKGVVPMLGIEISGIQITQCPILVSVIIGQLRPKIYLRRLDCPRKRVAQLAVKLVKMVNLAEGRAGQIGIIAGLERRK
jgi:hypothetical protein